jgi:hypothetical protein
MELDGRQINAIKVYTSAEGYTINSNLRSGLSVVEYKDVIDGLDSIFEEIEPLQETMIVYRDMNIELRGYTTLGYTSVTTKSDQLDGSKNEIVCCMYHITVPPGSKIIDLQKYSSHPSENELLLPRGGQFHYTGQTVKNNVICIFLSYLPPQSTIIENNEEQDKLREELTARLNQVNNIVSFIKNNVETLRQELEDENELFVDEPTDWLVFLRQKVIGYCMENSTCTEMVLEHLRNT